MTEMTAHHSMEAPAFVFWLMPDEDPQYEDWPHSTKLRAWQRGRCGICEMGDWFDRDLVMDHDHETGLIRGLICRSCNTSEPHNFTEPFNLWRSGLNTATALGIVEMYSSPFGGEPRTKREVTFDELDKLAQLML